MNVLIACDKFKGSLNASRVSQSIAEGIKGNDKKINCTVLPLADGGDGTLEILEKTSDFKKIECNSIDALGRPITSYYLSNQKQAFIELAEASGIARLHPSEYAILSASTFGTGQLIKHAIENGHMEIILTVGGSCSNDIGFGIAHALGYQFRNKTNRLINPNGGNLRNIINIIPPQKPIQTLFKILCDVKNPLFGKQGAAHVYGPQKGADTDTIQILDESMIYISNVIEEKFGKDIRHFGGAGAAGGVPAGLFGLLKNVSIQNGFEFISYITKLEEHINNANLIITGEGQFDLQSIQGKVVGQVIDLCQKFNKEVIIVTGQTKLGIEDLSSLKLNGIFEVIKHADDVNDSLKNCERYLRVIGKEIANMHLGST